MKNRELVDAQTLVSRISEARPPDDDDIRLGDYLHVLWVQRLWVLGIALLVAGLVAGQTLLSGRRYEATLMLAVNQSKIGDTEAASVAAANFRPLIENHGIADAIIQEFKLDQPPLQMTRNDFLGEVLGVQELRGTSLIQLRVRMADADAAARIANAVAAKAVDLARRLSQDEAVQARDYIKVQMDEAGKRLSEAEQRLKDTREASQLEALKKDVDSMLDERAELMKAEVKIAGLRAKVAKGEEELAKRTRFLVATRSIDTDPSMMEAARAAQGSAPNAPPSVIGLTLRNEIVDDVYRSIDEQLASDRAELSEFEKQRDTLVRSKGPLNGRLPQLTELYRREAEVARLEVEKDLAQKIYVDVSSRYQSARLQVAGRSAQLQIIDPALPPNQPLPRNTVSRTMMGLVIGLVLGILVVFVRQAIASAERRRQAMS